MLTFLNFGGLDFFTYDINREFSLPCFFLKKSILDIYLAMQTVFGYECKGTLFSPPPSLSCILLLYILLWMLACLFLCMHKVEVKVRSYCRLYFSLALQSEI